MQLTKNVLVHLLIVLMIPLGAYAKEFVLPKYVSEALRDSYDINHEDSKPSEQEDARAMRFKIVGIEAYSWGIQEGTYFRTNEIQDLLQKNSFTMNKTVSVGKFLVDGQMLMPTVLEAERIYITNHDREAQSVNMSYTIDKPPRIVAQPPTWRDYLLRSVKKPEKPIAAAHPKNDAEIVIWDKNFKRGFLRGIDQANSLFSSDLMKMRNEISGFYRFRFLLAQNIVTLPKMSKDKVSVMLLDSGKTINLNNIKYSITLDSTFNKVNEWKPVFSQGAAHE
jgi:defect-in-organelle-trafficking protein DotC